MSLVIPSLSPATLTELVDALVERGWYLGEGVVDAGLCRALYDELEERVAHRAMQAAGIGRGEEHSLRRDIRGDTIHWLDRATLAQRHYLGAMAELQQELNQALYLGLFEFEAHFAHYGPGTFYKKHRDSFRGRANRVVSTVCYLNPDWGPADGGEMVLYDPEDETREVARVVPRAGSFACFLADRVPHEVLPTARSRASIAGWFRRNASLNGVIDPAY
ncbi:2OG-Fe(II) oxygenase [Halomonas pacifica]|uniref:2OG-Fe(II) oxygenase n=1 Tax=Bisbaumannia pacifica TaxID=77098 RepID=UPI0023587B8E|nr:2OG-Fe(II) oxygenase [Halomonas pacifica]MDC8802402.1 2OG-Fe(II) oxygenase [Halomonas pacifica]